MDLVYFAALVSVLIFVHELGHFFWAKVFGVKVLMFSVGFGPKILRLRGRETEYCVGLFPLGGFVKMLGENRQEPVWPEDKHRTFEAQALYKRVVIVISGPLMNVLFPVLLYLGVILGQPGFPPPTIGTVLPQHAADGKLVPGDRVLAVDGVPISTFAELRRYVARSPGRELRLTVFRNNQSVEIAITPEERVVRGPLDIAESVGSIGVQPYRPAPVVGIADAGSPAYRAGLRSFDLITEVRGQRVATVADLERLIAENRGETVPVAYLRPTRVPQALGALADVFVYESGVAALTPEVSGADLRERTGLELADLYVADVEPDSAEYLAGLRPGDRVTAVDGAEVASWSMLSERLFAAPERPHTISWTRDGERHSGTVELRREEWIDGYGGRTHRCVLRARPWLPQVAEKQSGRPSLLRYALPSAIDETIDGVRFIVVGIVRIVQGRLGLSTIGGPITVYDVVAQEASKGPSYFLWAMAVISINLGLVNLLPIPVLDGGHLLFFGAEAVLRRPLPLRFREVASLVGLCLLLVLMGMALKNDVERRWDIIGAQVAELFG
ncbi:MAG: RIP metalloprotease RseP [Deltaproteobacteria bacterium]|nr:RIP metalloprotease RseP [Deltaproteobacteria bacterium]